MDLCHRLGAPELITDARFATPELRSKNGEALCPLLSEVLQTPGFRAPRLGEHTSEVLGALGLEDADLLRLRASGAIQ